MTAFVIDLEPAAPDARGFDLDFTLAVSLRVAIDGEAGDAGLCRTEREGYTK